MTEAGGIFRAVSDISHMGMAGGLRDFHSGMVLVVIVVVLVVKDGQNPPPPRGGAQSRHDTDFFP